MKNFEWSSIVDAPITYGMDLDELHDYIRCEYARDGVSQLNARLGRVRKCGTSFIGHKCLEDSVLPNRAGKNEEELTIDQIYELYAEYTPS